MTLVGFGTFAVVHSSETKVDFIGNPLQPNGAGATRNPSAPFMTSTLQQEASRKFGFGARQTMNAAQRLYEALRGEPVDPANFRRDVRATGLLEPTGALHSDGAGRPGKLYRREPSSPRHTLRAGPRSSAG